MTPLVCIIDTGDCNSDRYNKAHTLDWEEALIGIGLFQPEEILKLTLQNKKGTLDSGINVRTDVYFLPGDRKQSFSTTYGMDLDGKDRPSLLCLFGNRE